jgi:hypothetical protein
VLLSPPLFTLACWTKRTWTADTVWACAYPESAELSASLVTAPIRHLKVRTFDILWVRSLQAHIVRSSRRILTRRAIQRCQACRERVQAPARPLRTCGSRQRRSPCRNRIAAAGIIHGRSEALANAEQKIRAWDGCPGLEFRLQKLRHLVQWHRDLVTKSINRSYRAQTRSSKWESQLAALTRPCSSCISLPHQAFPFLSVLDLYPRCAVGLSSCVQYVCNANCDEVGDHRR